MAPLISSLPKISKQNSCIDILTIKSNYATFFLVCQLMENLIYMHFVRDRQ